MWHKRPEPWEVRNARRAAGLTMEEAGSLVYVGRKTWLNWEREITHREHRKMPKGYAELFALKAGLTTIEEVSPTLARINKLKT